MAWKSSWQDFLAVLSLDILDINCLSLIKSSLHFHRTSCLVALTEKHLLLHHLCVTNLEDCVDTDQMGFPLDNSQRHIAHCHNFTGPC